MKQWNIAEFVNASWEQLHKHQVDQLGISPDLMNNPEQLDKETKAILISPKELQVVQFFLSNGQEIVNTYFRQFVEVPPVMILDNLIDSFFEFIQTFVDLAMSG